MLRERGVSVLCIEPDPAQCARIREAGMTAFAGLDALPDGSLCYVYSLNVLEHIEDDESALRLIATKLASEGRLLLCGPAFQLLFSSMDRKVGHFRRYRRQQLIGLARRAGLKVVVARYADSLGFLATLVYKMAGVRYRLHRSAIQRHVRPVHFSVEALLRRRVRAFAREERLSGGRQITC